ncbi:MAG: hypothetical protein KDC23_07360 [Actinobacteria bacterium]|nr:hypothetical protein [Actinomycetota bacterium]
MSRFPRYLLLAALPALLATGCAQGEDSSSATTPPVVSGEVTPPPGSVSPATTVDPCQTLTAQQVVAVLGYSATSPQSNAVPGDAYALAACTWGGADQGTYLALQVFTPGAVDDPVSVLLGAAGEAPTPYPSLPQGQTWNLGFLPGGGGQGYTITWVEGEEQVALSLLGSDISAQQQQALQTAAGEVAAALG